MWSAAGQTHSFFRNVLKSNNSWNTLRVRAFSQPVSRFSNITQWPKVPSRRFMSLHSLTQTPFGRSRVPNNRSYSKFFPSSNPTASSHALPVLSPPSVGYWLLCSSALVFGIVVVGGMTRLTESGLSITEWKPITGIVPPINSSEWEDEFNKYKATPEFKLLNHQMTLSQFKKIFYMEYGHRVLGRLIGVVFVLPYLYFLASNRLTRKLPMKLGSLATLIGFQGFLGWYMVKSGLDDTLTDTPGAVPRVSQYRLAAHLGVAIVLYAGMLSTGMGILKDWKFANTVPQSGTMEEKWRTALSDQRLRRFVTGARFLTVLVFLTAISGAFVAGLDAGLVYNEFPLMGGRIMPLADELFSPAYAQSANRSDLWWRNIFENPTTVQFDHRLLALTTYTSTSALFLATLRPSLRALLPPITRQLVAGTFAMANLQVLLGISTLLYMVPLPIAAAHQAGSVVLLTLMIALMTSLRRPGAVARLMRDAQHAKGH